MSATGPQPSSSAADDEAVVSSTTEASSKPRKRKHEKRKVAITEPRMLPMIVQKVGENDYRVKRREEYMRAESVPARTDITKCSYCQHTFETLYELRMHMKSRSQRTSCMKSCVGCSNLYHGGGDIPQERVLPSVPEKLLFLDLEVPDTNICTTCNEVFKTVRGMKMHRTKIHITKEKRSIQCLWCNAIFQTIKQFTLHKKKCLRELKDATEIIEGDTTPASSSSMEQPHNSVSSTQVRMQTNTRKSHSSRPSHSRNVNGSQSPAETVHNNLSTISAPSTSTQAPGDGQQPPQKRRRQSSPQPQPQQQAPPAENRNQEEPVKRLSRFVPDLLRNLLQNERDKKTPSPHYQAKESSLPQRGQVEEANSFPSGGNYRVDNLRHSGDFHARNQSDQQLQTGSSVVKRRRYYGNREIDATAGPSYLNSATAQSQFALKECHVVLSNIQPIGEQSSLLNTEEQLAQVAPEEMEASSGYRDGQDTNSNNAVLSSPSNMIDGCTFSSDQSGEEAGSNGGQQSTAENVVSQIPMEDEDTNVRDALPQSKCKDISKQMRDNDLPGPSAVYMGGTVTNSKPSSGNGEVANAALIDGTGVEHTEDSDSQKPTDNCDLCTPEDPLTHTKNKTTPRHINRRTENSVSNSITNTLAANGNYRNKPIPRARINESSPDNESLTDLATVRNECSLRGFDSLSGKNSSFQNLSIYGGPSQAEILHTTSIIANSEVLPKRMKKSTDHSNTIMTEHGERDPCIVSPAQFDTITDSQIFNDTFFDDILSTDTPLPGDTSEELDDLSLSPITTDENDIPYNLSFRLAKEQKNDLNNFSYNEETGFHSTNDQSCIGLETTGIWQKHKNSFFPGGECDKVNYEKTQYNSVPIQETENKEISKPIFDDDYVSETSLSTLDEDETYLKKLVKEARNQHFSYNEETGFHNTNDQTCLDLETQGLKQKHTSRNSFFPGGECDKVNYEKSQYNSIPIQETENKEISKPIFDDDYVSETSLSTSDEDETYLQKLVKEARKQCKKKSGSPWFDRNGDSELTSDKEISSQQALEALRRSLSSPDSDSQTETGSSPGAGQANEAQAFAFQSNNNDHTCTSQRSVSSNSQLTNTYETVTSDTQHTEVDFITSDVLCNGNYEVTSIVGSNQMASNTDEDEDLTYDMKESITDGTEESYSPKSSTDTDWSTESSDTQTYTSPDESQNVEGFISENSSEAASSNGSDSGIATGSTPGSQLLSDFSDWSPLSNRTLLFPDSPLNVEDSPDLNLDLTFNGLLDTKDCNTIADELLKELISSNFPSLLDHDFGQNSSADEDTTDSVSINFEAINFDLLVASPPYCSDQHITPEIDATNKEMETASHHNPEPRMMDHNEALLHKAGSNIPSKIENMGTIECSTKNYNMFTNNNAAESTTTELVGETHANHTEQAAGSTEEDKDNFTHYNSAASEIVSKGPEWTIVAAQSPSEQVVTYSEIVSTETAQYDVGMDMNSPDQDTVMSATDNILISLSNLAPSCSTSQYQEASEDSSYYIVTEDKENPIHGENHHSSNSITSDAQKCAMAENNIRNKTTRNSSQVGTCTTSSITGVFDKVNFSKSTLETGRGISSDGNIVRQSSQQNINEMLQKAVSSASLVNKTQSSVLNPKLTDQISDYAQITNRIPSRTKVAKPRTRRQKDRQQTTGDSAKKNVSLLNADNKGILKTKQISENSVAASAAEYSNSTNKTSHNMDDLCTIKLTSKLSGGTEFSKVTEVTNGGKLLYNDMGKPDQKIAATKNTAVLTSNTVSLLGVVGNSSRVVTPLYALIVATASPQMLPRAGNVQSNNRATSLVQMINDNSQQGAVHKGDTLAADSEITVIKETIPMPQRGNMSATFNGKPNGILQTKEISTPQEAAEAASDSESSALSLTSEPDEKSEKTVRVQLVKVQPSGTSDGAAVGRTTAEDAGYKQGGTYRWVTVGNRVDPAKDAKATSSLGRVVQKCHCGRRFHSVRSLHQHQTWRHFQKQIIPEESEGTCDNAIHPLSHKRYECPCGNILRSLPDAYRCCLQKYDGQNSQRSPHKLALCKCKLSKTTSEPSAEPSSPDKQTDTEVQ